MEWEARRGGGATGAVVIESAGDGGTAWATSSAIEEVVVVVEKISVVAREVATAGEVATAAGERIAVEGGATNGS